jgi:amino acid adenylation domain-containing protein
MKKKINYRELDEMSNSLAWYLREQGIGRNDIVPIISERSYYYIIGIIGISKAGGAFLPIDPEFPVTRINDIINEVKPKIILEYSNNKKEYHEYIKMSMVHSLQLHNYDINRNYISNINSLNDICYIMFTSGTTGKPKGSIIKHSNLNNYCNKFECKEKSNFNMYNYVFDQNNVENVLGISRFTFDLSIIEFILSLTKIKTTVLVDSIIGSNIELLSDYIKINKVDFITAPPTRIKIFLENDKFKQVVKYLKVIILIGEPLTLSMFKLIRKYSDCKIFNGYGPTETTVIGTAKEITSRNCENITIGKPFCNYEIYILDKYMKPVPVGVEGEICIGGKGVGKGYLNRKELTNEKFVKNPFQNDNNSKSSIIYKTGDLGKWTKDGEVICLGRMDFQVKIHGQRIELGEIEESMKEIVEIESCVVIDKLDDNNEKYLIGYYITKFGMKIEKLKIRNDLKAKIPNYMIPKYFIEIEYIPTNVNGKLDRKALPEPSENDLILNDYVKPESETEIKLCNI